MLLRHSRHYLYLSGGNLTFHNLCFLQIKNPKLVAFFSQMMINNSTDRTLSAATPSGSGNCRQNGFSDKVSKHIRRKRMEVRRLKSICQTETDFGGNCFCKKNKRSDEMRRGSDLTEKPSVMAALSSAGPPVSSSSDTDVDMVGRESPGISHGSISVIGRRREMEDAVAVELGFVGLNSMKYDFYGVYDGHGGSKVAHACCGRLHRLMVKEVVGGEAVGSKVVDWEKVMMETFRKMDEEVMNIDAVGSVGSTAVVAVVGEEVVAVANCGDSRAVMSRGGTPVAMSHDHKPDRPDELKRIEDSGGRVIDWNGQRVLGVLAISRSIGDKHLKPYVIAQPEVILCERTKEDEFLILGSDGLWDVIPNDFACQVVRRCLNGRMRRRSSSSQLMTQEGSSESVNEGRATEAAAVLAELAMARGSKDNISVVVVDLKKPAHVHSI